MKQLLLSLTIILFTISGYAQGQTKLDSLLTVLKTAKEDTSKVNMLIVVCLEKINLGKYEEARKFADAALALSEKINFKEGMADSYNRIGNIYDNISDDSIELKYYKKALTIYEKSDNKKGIAETLHNIGGYYLGLSDFPKALENYQKALTLNVQLNNKAGIANDYNNIGLVYNDLSDYPKALENYQKSLAINEHLGDKKSIARNLYYIGVVYKNCADYPKALLYFQDALAINEPLGYNDGIACSLMGMGQVYNSLADYSNALEYYQKSLKIFEESVRKNGTASCLISIGGIYQKQSRFPEALKYVTKGLSVALEIGAKDWIEEAYQRLAVIDSAMNNFRGAYENHKRYSEIKDSVFNMERDKKLTALQMKYEFDKIQDSTKAVHAKTDAVNSEIISKQRFMKNSFIIGFLLVLFLLGVLFSRFRSKRRANVILTENSKIISGMLVEKDILLKEIHHRVKNNLEVISSLLELQSDGMVDEKAKAAIAAGQARVQSIALIHHKLYRTDNVASIEFTGFIRDLFNQISHVFLKDGADVTLNLKGEELLLEIDVAVPLGLILNELFTNSFKYAVTPGKQNIFSIELIKIAGENSMYKIIYRDNGPGLPKDFDLEKSTSLGMKVIHLLTKQLGGKVNYYFEHGSVFEIPININKNKS